MWLFEPASHVAHGELVPVAVVFGNASSAHRALHAAGLHRSRNNRKHVRDSVPELQN